MAKRLKMMLSRKQSIRVKKLRCKGKYERKGRGGRPAEEGCASCGESGHDVDVIPVNMTTAQVQEYLRQAGE